MASSPGATAHLQAFLGGEITGLVGCLGDLLAAPGPSEEPEDLLALTRLIAELPELERTVIVLRFFQELSQSAIAARVGYSQMHVLRLLGQALARMRTQLLEPDPPPTRSSQVA